MEGELFMNYLRSTISVKCRRAVVRWSIWTPKEREQGHSLQAQQEFLRSYAARHDLVIDREFVDLQAANKPERRGFSEMLHYLRKNPG